MSIEDSLPPSLKGVSEIQTFEPATFLFSRGSPCNGVYEVVIGRVRLQRMNEARQEISLYVAREGEALAEASLFSDVYHCDAVAVTKSIVRMYPKRQLLAEFERNSDFAKAYAALLARQVMSLRTYNELLRQHAVRDRIRYFLLLNAGADGQTIEVKGPLKDLAVELGMAHEVLYRTLARMADDGEIERVGNVIRLLLPR